MTLTTTVRMRRILIGALLLAIFVSGLPANATMTTPPKIRINFDDTAVRQLIALVNAKDTSDASLDRWLDLPANRYILKTGDNEQNLTREQFKKNAIAVINGTATPQTQRPNDIGCLWMSSTADFSAMLDRLEATENDRVARIIARDSSFAPDATSITETVYVHLGGDWDAVNDHGSIYLNMRFWHDTGRPGWDGVNMIVAHETMHSIQNAAYGNPENQSDSNGAFLTALSKIQREGTARYVEYDADPGPYSPGTYGFFERALDTESYRAFPRDIKILKSLTDACFPTFNHDMFVDAFQTGIDTGGPYYDVGYGIAKAIDERMGRPALIDTVERGPKQFFTQYIALSAGDRQLPKIPDDVVRAVEDMPEKL